jgi:hypothetical protein
MRLSLSMYQLLRSDQPRHSLLPHPPSRSPSSHCPACSPRQSRRRVPRIIHPNHCNLSSQSYLNLAIHPPARLVASSTDIIAPLALSGYTQTWPPTPRTYASIYRCLLSPISSFPCADPAASPLQPDLLTFSGYPPVSHHIQSSPGLPLHPSAMQRCAGAHDLVELVCDLEILA